MTINSNFNYDEAFSRNIGWFSPQDQKLLKNKCIAIAGLGGVGGHHLHGFLRLGFANFHIADPDVFEIKNFNRQEGSNVNSLGRAKGDALIEMAKAINPEVNIKFFNQGITEHNQQEFLSGVDIVIDALDLFAMDMRISLYDLAYEKGLPVVTAGPFGMGTSVMAFNPKGLSFNKYFDLKNNALTVEAKIIRFLAGISPSMMHTKYLRYRSAVNLFEKRLPSLNIGCLAASAALGAISTKILLDINSKNIRWAPHGFHVDFNLHKSIRFYRPWGNRNPIQILRIKAYHRFFNKPEYKSPN